MSVLSRREVIAAALAAPAAFTARAQESDGWIPLFDGRTLDGWKAGGNAHSFRVEDGQIVASGPTTHLYYAGGVKNADFKNFELTAEAMARPGANSGIYFHTRYQPSGWPAAGFEVQVANTHTGEHGYIERKKTGSLYAVRNVYKQLVKDDEWFRMRIAVRGKEVRIHVNDMLVVDYVEPDPPVRIDPAFERVVGHGTFALQAHDPKSRVHFRNILVRPLPDDAAPLSADRPVADDLYRQVLRMSTDNYPVVDYHTHLKGGLTLAEALANSRRLGVGYGIAANCGISFPIHTDAAVRDYLASMRNQPCFVALQAEGREWVKLVKAETVAQFDYVFSDAMTWTDDDGRRMRLWIPEEVGEIRDSQRFMEMLVHRIEGILSREPIDIYANPTFLPRAIADNYDALWTEQRMRRVIDAAVKNGVAIEINNTYRLPKPAFLRMAKASGAKFSFGTNNAGRELGRLEYPLQMVRECGLKWQDIFVPRPEGQKPVQLKGLPA